MNKIDAYIRELDQHVNNLTIANGDIYENILEFCITAESVFTRYGIDENVEKYLRSVLTPYLYCDDYRVTCLIFSYFIKFFKKEKDLGDFLLYQLETNRIENISTRAFLLYQSASVMFVRHEVESIDNRVLLWKLYRHIAGLFENAIGEKLEMIPPSERNSNLVIVLVDQFTYASHAPTKLICSLAKTLKQQLKKNVIVINTAEVLAMSGRILLADTREATYVDEYKNLSSIIWEDCEIPYFQCDNVMMNADAVRIIIDFIRTQKPAYVVAVAGSFITANLVSKIVPTLSYNLRAGIEYTEALFQSYGNENLSSDDKRVIEKLGKSEDSIIFSKPIIQIGTVNKIHSRSEFGINENAFLGVIVSGRLEYELGDAFLKVLEKINRRTEFLILGDIETGYCDFIKENYPGLDGRMHYIGRVDGVLDYYDMCDVYINMERRGGGFSSVEALARKLPVITPNYGDVAANVGEEFCIDSIEDLPETIEKYMLDSDYYNLMCDKALNRANEITNTGNAMVSIITEFENRIKN